MRMDSSPRSRRGMTLLEVIVALAIFLMSIVAIYRLTDLAKDAAEEIVNQSRATRLLESKMAEFVSGVEPLSGGSTSGNFDDEPEWNWSAEVDADAITNLYKITLTISKDVPNGPAVTTQMTQYVMDPTQKGYLTTSATLITQTPITTTASSSSSSASGSTTGSAGGGGSMSGLTKGGSTSTAGTKSTSTSNTSGTKSTGTNSNSNSGTKSSTPSSNSGTKGGSTKGG